MDKLVSLNLMIGSMEGFQRIRKQVYNKLGLEIVAISSNIGFHLQTKKMNIEKTNRLISYIQGVIDYMDMFDDPNPFIKHS